MAARELSAQIANVILNTNHGSLPMYLLRNTEEVLDALSTRRGGTVRQGEHGMEDSLSFFEPRVLHFTGEIHATSQAQRVTMQQALDKALSLGRYQSVGDGYKLVKITDEDGIPKQVYAKVISMPRYQLIEAGMPESRTFEFTMIASDPAVYAQELTEESAFESFQITTLTFQDGALPTFQDGDLPTCQDQTDAIVLLENIGTFGSPPMIVLEGPTTDPVIRNLTEGKKLEFSRNGGVVLAEGDTLTINTALQTAVKTSGSEEENVRNRLSLDSEWFDLQPGANNLTFTDDTLDDLSGRITISFRSAWL
jgi:hypothetical protein